jgi:hypothetical protein
VEDLCTAGFGAFFLNSLPPRSSSLASLPRLPLSDPMRGDPDVDVEGVAEVLFCAVPWPMCVLPPPILTSLVSREPGREFFSEVFGEVAPQPLDLPGESGEGEVPAEVVALATRGGAAGEPVPCGGMRMRGGVARLGGG